MQKIMIALTAMCFSISVAQALPAVSVGKLPTEIEGSADALSSGLVRVKDTSKPGSANTSRFQAPRQPPDDSAKQNKPQPKTGGIPASVLAPKLKR